MMAEAQLFVLEDEFTCTVCLNTLTDPVTIPCGHNFCLKCLTDCWDQSQECSCPHCRHTFTTRPALRRNTLLTEVVKKLKKSRLSRCAGKRPALRRRASTSGCRSKQGSEVLFIFPITHSQISSLVFFSLLSDFCPLTLDINTANRFLRLSERNKKVTHEGTKAEYPDHPDRFDCCVQVLCREALTGTRCYWEVECSERFMKIGVAYKGLDRKGEGSECGLGYNDKSWSLVWSLSQYSVRHNKKEIVISAPFSPRIGVYLDWPAGSLSFYRVSHTMTLLHRFNISFTEPLYPGFGFGLHCSVTISHLTPCDH
uniref:B30.2/SPRY domain-containing protein n=1 Tax=Erpetoichthys calabaricus TaxID=27687 RepID=A0A8C4TCN8_ERPCA